MMDESPENDLVYTPDEAVRTLRMHATSGELPLDVSTELWWIAESVAAISPGRTTMPRAEALRLAPFLWVAWMETDRRVRYCPRFACTERRALTRGDRAAAGEGNTDE